MTKKHHPHSRAERLALKGYLLEQKKDREASASKVRRYKESLKERETEDELREFTGH